MLKSVTYLKDHRFSLDMYRVFISLWAHRISRVNSTEYIQSLRSCEKYATLFVKKNISQQPGKISSRSLLQEKSTYVTPLDAEVLELHKRMEHTACERCQDRCTHKLVDGSVDVASSAALISQRALSPCAVYTVLRVLPDKGRDAGAPAQLPLNGLIRKQYVERQ
jgi:hypothetical protein